MPHFAIVIEDPAKARKAEVDRNVRANVHRHVKPQMAPRERQVALARLTAVAEQVAGVGRGAGDLHTTCDDACPDGLPNCRNCGDPAHREACRAAGHCPHCGTRHGIAPDSVLAAGGMSLQEVPGGPLREGDAWDAARRKIVRKP